MFGCLLCFGCVYFEWLFVFRFFCFGVSWFVFRVVNECVMVGVFVTYLVFVLLDFVVSVCFCYILLICAFGYLILMWFFVFIDLGVFTGIC